MALPELEGSGRPFYVQIAEHLRAEIESGVRTRGSRLPPIRAYATELSVNRDTVALAYDTLAGEGLLESTVGRGTFVHSGSLASSGEGEPVEAALAPTVESLLRFENARPRLRPSPDAVPLHSLIPDPGLYPVESFRQCLDRVLAAGGPELFLYGGPQGHPGLRERLAERLRERAIDCTADDIILCHGASQGISLAIRLFAEAGDSIAVEAPTYHNVLSTLVSYGIGAASVPMRPDGPDLDVLDRSLARPEVKAFYTIPTFHNPMGTTTKLAHRRAHRRAACAWPLGGRRGRPEARDGPL
jgi:DNA-binding transcriptional MocR family regulator